MILRKRARVLFVLCAAVAVFLLAGASSASAAGPATWTLSPPAGSTTSTVRPLITATARDSLPLRYSSSTTWAQMKLDGRVVKITWAFAPGDTKCGTMSYLPPAPLSSGPHTVYVHVSNTANVYSTLTYTFTVSAAPVIGTLTPADGSTSATDHPAIAAIVTPNAASLSSYSMSVDGSAVTPAWDPGTGVLSYTPPSALRNDAAHDVAISVTNSAGQSASISWSFDVQIYAEMTDAAGCTECHLLYPTLHPMENCAACHGPDSPVGEGWSSPPDAPHTSSWLSSDCVSCHNPYYGGVPRHTGSLTEDHATSTDMSGCACHVRSLTIEHARHTTPAGPITCVTCHTSTKPAVIAAIATGARACYDCHGIAEHESVHIVLVPPGCAGSECHDGTSLTGIHTAPGCAGCHASEDPSVVAAIANHNRDCSGCHDPSPHALQHAVTPPADCASCHPGTDLVSIHTGPGCAGCHDSTDPEVVAAIASHDRTCSACHVRAGTDFHLDMSMHISSAATYETCGHCHHGWGSNPIRGHDVTRHAGGCVTCHNAELDLTGKTVECASCHDIEGTNYHRNTVATHSPTDTGSLQCVSCHGTTNVRELHGPAGCGLCHVTYACGECHGAHLPVTLRCSRCHSDKYDAGGGVAPHGFNATTHTADDAVATGSWPAPGDNATYNPPYAFSAPCSTCHELQISAAHGAACATCHPTPRDQFTTWDKSCTAAGCHAAASGRPQHSMTPTASHAMRTEDVDAGCGFVGSRSQYACHYRDLVQEHNRLVLKREGPRVVEPISVSCAACHSSSQYLGLGGTWDGSCVACHPASHGVVGSARYGEVRALHDNPGGAYDNGEGNAGSNAMDAHGPIRIRSGATGGDHGCATTTCHTAAYLGGGYPYPNASCSSCHGPTILLPPAHQGDRSWYGGQGYDGEPREATLTYSALTLPAGATALDFWTWYDIEQGWDYAYVEVSTDGGSTWTTVTGDRTTAANPNGNNAGAGITGSSGGWVATHYDLSTFSGQTVGVRLRYSCDEYVYGTGWLVDELAITGPSGTVFSDDAETLKPEWTADLWERSTP